VLALVFPENRGVVQVHSLEQQNMHMAAAMGSKAEETAALAQRLQDEQRSHFRELGAARRPLLASR